MQITAKTKNFFTAAALAVLLCAVPAKSSAGVAISITIAPPVLPVYVQPPCPVEGYLWTPGYWAWGPYGYYWVPGVWVAPPRIGFLWTPGYWGFANGIYLWHAGYWGPHVGFYGGVNYGFGYTGVGFVGGFWSGNVFRYNTAVTNVNRTVIRNVYVDRTVVNNTGIANNRASFNGPGGVTARPTAREQAALREQHFQPTANQLAHQRTASQDRSLLASSNHGRPSVTAMDSVNGRRVAQQGPIANGRTAAPQERQQVNRERTYEQPQRAPQGVHSGQMAPGGAAKADNRERNIGRQSIPERQANTVRQTAPQRSNVNRAPNGEGRQVNQEKHNERTAPR